MHKLSENFFDDDVGKSFMKIVTLLSLSSIIPALETHLLSN